MYLLLFCAPGGREGTPAGVIKEEIGPHLASGDMFREAMAAGTPLGLEVKNYVDSGKLVPDELTVAMVLDRLSRPDCKAGALLDGFPGTVGQAQALDTALAK